MPFIAVKKKKKKRYYHHFSTFVHNVVLVRAPVPFYPFQQLCNAALNFSIFFGD